MTDTTHDPRQRDLFSQDEIAAAKSLNRIAQVFTGKTETSLEAAHYQAKSGKAMTDRDRVLLAIADRPRTTDALCHDLNLRHQTCSARVNGLKNSGLVEYGERKEKTSTGKNASVVELTAKGREYVRSKKGDT